MAHEYGARLALIAFATAIVQALALQAAFEPSVRQALAAAAAFYVLGWLCGEMARRAVEESVRLDGPEPHPVASHSIPIPTAQPTGR